MKWKKEKTMWVFLCQQYGKFWSILLELFVQHKPSNCEEWLYIFSLFPIERAHMNINKYKCHMCDFKTNLSKNRLETHIKIKHMKNSTFECRHCEFVTPIYKRLRTHVSKIHAPLKRKTKIIINWTTRKNYVKIYTFRNLSSDMG